MSDKKTKPLINSGPKKKLKEDTKNKAVQAALTAPYKDPWYKRAWDSLHHQFVSSWLSMIMILALTATLSGLGTTLFTKPILEQESKKGFSLTQRIEQLKKSHNYYTKVATKEEMLVRWIELYSKSKYDKNGDPKYNKYDCVGSTYGFLATYNFNIPRIYNSQVPIMNVPYTVKRIENLIARGEQKKRKSLKEVRHGDIIVIQMKVGKPSHLGIVNDVKNGQVIYMDVNANLMGAGYSNSYKWGDYRIYGIYEVSFSFWIGDLLKEDTN